MSSAPTAREDPKVAAVKAEIADVQKIMVQNIEATIARGERLENTQEATERLAIQAKGFQRDSGRLRRVMWWKNVKLMIICGSILFAILLIVILAIVLSTKH
jgi:hypothetical protein